MIGRRAGRSDEGLDAGMLPQAIRPLRLLGPRKANPGQIAADQVAECERAGLADVGTGRDGEFPVRFRRGMRDERNAARIPPSLHAVTRSGRCSVSQGVVVASLRRTGKLDVPRMPGERLQDHLPFQTREQLADADVDARAESTCPSTLRSMS